MRPTYAGLAAGLMLALGSARVAQASCTASPTTLCLNDGRFAASVAWKDFKARTGVGTAVPITSDTGYFWFFSSSNIELVIKVLDARTVNGKFWVFFGALSNVEYTLTVKDTVTNATKTYVNPSGQFASVADTKAFDPNGAASTRTKTTGGAGSHSAPEALESIQRFIDVAAVETSAKATTAFSPCLGPSTSLGLNNCRFLLHVGWHDSHGRTGEGNAVQLTNDTGYFWFFGPANVELVVKVLDARSFSGKFWVFYGALSDVEYHLTVTDTLTGVVKSYTNSAGTLASVGDTTAFAAGTSVVAVKDDSRATSGDIDSSGGTLTATGADGSIFTLEIPPDALVLPTLITMTPLSRVDGYPFAGGLKAGVQLEPEGLFLFEPGILTIEAASPSTPGNRAVFSYRGSGDEFILYPPELDPSQVRLHVTHFSGYGHGEFMGEDEGPSACEQVPDIIAQQAGRPTSRHFDSYIQRTYPFIVQLWCGKIDEAQYDAAVKPIWEDAWGAVVYPAIQSLSGDCNPDNFDPVLRIGFEYIHDVDVWINDHSFSDIKREILLDTVKQVAFQCADEAYFKCKNEHRIEQAVIILGISRELQRAQLIDDQEFTQLYGEISGCLAFKVKFDTTVTVGTTQEGLTLVEQMRLTAEVPVYLEAIGNQFVLTGEGPLTYQLLEGSLSDPDCPTISFTSEGSTFHVDRLGIDGLSLKYDDILNGRYRFNADMTYRPGDPTQVPTLHCSRGSAPFPLFRVFRPAYLNLHQGEWIRGNSEDPAYVFLQWDPILNGDQLAKKVYEDGVHAGELDSTEETTLTLIHTPL